MVGRPGVEPESVEPQSTVLPLDDQPHNGGEGGIRTHGACATEDFKSTLL